MNNMNNINNQSSPVIPSETGYYIIRADRAGVFLGQIAERRGSEVDLTNVRRIRYWSGAADVDALASFGPSRPRDCQFTKPVPSASVLNVIQIIPVSSAALSIFNEVPNWTA